MLQWILNEGRYLPGPGPFLAELCAKLADCGLGLMRSSVQIRTLHPEVNIVVYLWTRPEARDAGIANEFMVSERSDPKAANEVREISFGHGSLESETFRVSPFYRVVECGETIRRRLGVDQESFEFPILKDLHAAGATDYLALPIRFSQGPLSAASFVTDKEGGFADDDISVLTHIMPALSLCLEVHASRHTTGALLRTYLGADPGQRVLSGQVAPGDVRRIEAAILFSDLRGFTTLSNAMDSKELITTLNDYFEIVGAALEKHGGQILKFIGDALLVVFTLESPKGAARACEGALQAALDANRGLDRLNATRKELGKMPLEHGMGLHIGAAEYGNIGSTTRLDFTVIGHDVNLASRIEGQCGKLGRRLIASSEFAARIPKGQWIELGAHPLKGVEGAQSLFGVEEPEGDPPR